MEILYSWEFDDNKDRGPYWYIIALSIMIGVVIWGFLTRQYGMSFVILFLSGLFYYIENNSEDIVKVSLSDVGVQVGLNFYEYSKIEKFTFIYEGDNPIYLRLVVNKTTIRSIDLKIDRDILIEIKKILPEYIEEDTKAELTFIEKMTHKLKL